MGPEELRGISQVLERFNCDLILLAHCYYVALLNPYYIQLLLPDSCIYFLFKKKRFNNENDKKQLVEFK